MGSKKISAPALEVPRTREEAEILLGDLGLLMRRVEEIERKLNDQLVLLKAEAEVNAKPLNDLAEAKFNALHAWAEANRQELLKAGSKTHKMATGELSWRTSPPSVRVNKPEHVMDVLRQHGIERFIRSKDETNKEAILDEPAAVDGIRGISISQSEMFVAKPFEAKVEKVKPVKVSAKVAA